MDQINLTPEDFAIFQRTDSTTECNYWQADRKDAKTMKDAQVMRYWSGYVDMNGCEVDLRLDYLQRF